MEFIDPMVKIKLVNGVTLFYFCMVDKI